MTTTPEAPITPDTRAALTYLYPEIHQDMAQTRVAPLVPTITIHTDGSTTIEGVKAEPGAPRLTIKLPRGGFVDVPIGANTTVVIEP